MFLYLSMPSPRPLDGPHLSPASCVHSLASWRLSHMASNTISGHQAPRGVVTPTASITHSWPCTERFAKDKHLEHYVCTKKDFAIQKRVTRTSRVKEMPTKATQQRFHCRKVGSLIPKALVCFNHPVALGWVV